MTNTKARHLEIYNAAVEVLENAGGVAVVDALPQEDRTCLLRVMAKDISARTNCHRDSARRNIAKAIRRAHFGIMQEQWGGIRPGAGRPSNE